jgi:hypothetical protein
MCEIGNIWDIPGLCLSPMWKSIFLDHLSILLYQDPFQVFGLSFVVILVVLSLNRSLDYAELLLSPHK